MLNHTQPAHLQSFLALAQTWEVWLHILELWVLITYLTVIFCLWQLAPTVLIIWSSVLPCKALDVSTIVGSIPFSRNMCWVISCIPVPEAWTLSTTKPAAAWVLSVSPPFGSHQLEYWACHSQPKFWDDKWVFSRCWICHVGVFIISVYNYWFASMVE